MAHRLRLAAGKDPMPVHDALVRMIRRWESGRGGMTERYELLYAAALGIEPDRLRLGSDIAENSESETLMQSNIDDGPTLLRVLLTERHWQVFKTFEVKFARAAAELAAQEGEPSLAKVCVSRRQFERWYAGTVKSQPYPDACRVLEHIPEENSHNLVFSPLRGEEDDEEVMRRRAFLLNAALLAAIGKTDPVMALETVRRGLNQSFPGRSEADLSEWNEIASEYGETYLSTAPAELINSLIVDFSCLQEAFRRYPQDAAQRELYRVSSLLAGFVAQTVANLGHANEARRWWRTARHAADRSGNSYSALWVRGREIIHSMGERPITAVLGLIEEAECLIDGAPHELVLEFLGGKAQTLAVAGRKPDAETTLTQLRERFEATPFTGYSGSLLAWGEERLWNTESFTYSRLGNYGCTESAQQAASALYRYDPSNLRWPAGIEMNRAFCMVRNGAVAEGVAHARKIIAELPTGQQTRGIFIHGRDVLNAVPPAQSNKPAIIEYREWLDSSFSTPRAQLSALQAGISHQADRS